jgi:hypothetical protein
MHDFPRESDAFLLLGQVVFEMQETEATLHLAMSIIFGLSIAKSLEHLKKIYEKKTLGQFLALAREKLDINPSFDGYMKDYIDRRNFAIHNISRASDFDVYSSEGRAKFVNFLTDLRYRNRKINITFIALTEFFIRKIDPEWVNREKIWKYYRRRYLERLRKNLSRGSVKYFPGIIVNLRRLTNRRILSKVHVLCGRLPATPPDSPLSLYVEMWSRWRVVDGRFGLKPVPITDKSVPESTLTTTLQTSPKICVHLRSSVDK